ncbi:transglycosylase SLT domain-containing protein [bacterium]|nr:transglycosylase SLT domain-containing protein [bacterium]
MFMDGTSLVVLFIVAMFFFNSPNVFQKRPPKKNLSEYSQLKVDQSDWHYRHISEERMKKIIKKYNSTLSESDTNRIIMAVNRYGKEKNQDPRLILAFMARESRFNPQAVSPTGAIGLGQVMPMNFKDLGITNAYDIDQGTKGLVYYFQQKLNDWKDKKDQLGLAIASYLEGSGAIRRNGAKYSGHTEVYVKDILKIRGSI